MLEQIRKSLSGVYRKFSNHSYSYHFIHIPKNGGNSVRHALKRRSDVSTSNPLHYRYIDIADRVGRELRFFCIIRNPWSRTASRYQFAKQDSQSWPKDDPRRTYIVSASFEDFVKDQKIFQIPEHPDQPWMGPMNSWFNQLEWITDESGAVSCDCLRLEHIRDDLHSYFGTPVEIPKVNVTKNRYDYRDMYTDETAQIVADIFKEDIAHFGFEFDTPATRSLWHSGV